MSVNETIKQKFEVAGQFFDTKAEATDFLRKPKVIAALNAITSGNAEVNEWLYENQELLEDIFSAGTIQRVTKAEKKKIAESFNYLKNMEEVPKQLAFLVENAGAFQESFRWPSVKRMEATEKATLIKTSLDGATGNEKLTEWIIASFDKIKECFEAGKIKREVAPAAAAGLALYREKKAAEKAAEEAAKAAETAE